MATVRHRKSKVMEPYIIANNDNLKEHPDGELRDFILQEKAVGVTGDREWHDRLLRVLEGETDREAWILENGLGKIAHVMYRGAAIQSARLPDGTPVHFASLEEFTVEEAESPPIRMIPHAICRRSLSSLFKDPHG
jgi:hypothetical protein